MKSVSSLKSVYQFQASRSGGRLQVSMFSVLRATLVFLRVRRCKDMPPGPRGDAGPADVPEALSRLKPLLTLDSQRGLERRDRRRGAVTCEGLTL